jgi:hypothetical protein
MIILCGLRNYLQNKLIVEKGRISQLMNKQILDVEVNIQSNGTKMQYLYCNFCLWDFSIWDLNNCNSPMDLSSV